jgi:type VI secretion system secreted protein VgrG
MRRERFRPIQAGAARITLRKDGTVTIKGKDIVIEGTGDAAIKAGKDVILKGKKVLDT